MAKIQKRLLYLEVQNEIVQYILREKLKVGDALPSEGKMSETFDVSKMTIKKALDHLEKQGVIERLARKGSYIKDIRPLKKENPPKNVRSKYIAIIVCGLDEYISSIVCDIQLELEKYGYDLIIKNAHNEIEKENQYINHLSQNPDISGIITFPGNRVTCSEQVMRLKLKNYPLVVLDRVYKEVEFDCVYHDHYGGAAEIVSFLIDQGHVNIGAVTLVSSDDDVPFSISERYRGYLDTLLKYKLPVLDEYILKIDDFINEKDDIVDFLLNRTAVTALFCMNDHIAVRILKILSELEMKVPDDISLVGFSDHDILNFISVGLTSVKQPTKPMAKEAVRVLLERIADPSIPLQKVVIPTKPVIRKSVKNIKI